MNTNPLSQRAAEFVSSSKLRAVLAFTVISDIEALREAHRWCRANGSPQKAELIFKTLNRFAPGGSR